MIIHDFNECLAQSHAAEDMPFWAEIYRAAFPTMRAMVNHRQDGQHQRNGIDRSIVLESAKTILIDEKVRGRNKITGIVYNDIALEYWGNEGRRIEGWVCKNLLCDYIAYAIAPLGMCYLLPVPQLQLAWEKYGVQWVEKYKEIRAHNRNYITVSVGVPVDVLFCSIGKQLRISFKKFEINE